MNSNPISNSSNPDIDATELLARMNAGEQLNLLDVREVTEFSTYNIGGLNIPLSQLQAKMHQAGLNKTGELIVIYKAGLRSETAQTLLQQHGFRHVRNLTGGLMAVARQKSKINL